MPDALNQFPATLAERIAQLDAARAPLMAELSLASERPPSGKWSAAEIAYHLHLVERGIGRMLQKFLAPDAAAARHERRDDAQLRAEWERVSRLASPEFFPVEAPAPVSPKDAPGLAEGVALLNQSRQSLRDTLNATTLDALASFSRPHLIEAMGMLTGAGWVSMIAYHELRHAEQLRRMRAARS
jgi:hypothetical protein